MVRAFLAGKHSAHGAHHGNTSRRGTPRKASNSLARGTFSVVNRTSHPKIPLTHAALLHCCLFSCSSGPPTYVTQMGGTCCQSSSVNRQPNKENSRRTFTTSTHGVAAVSTSNQRQNSSPACSFACSVSTILQKVHGHVTQNHETCTATLHIAAACASHSTNSNQRPPLSFFVGCVGSN